ncbi:MAG: hypothetical protein ACLFP8_01960 [Alphaproteobacteria bacterium]
MVDRERRRLLGYGIKFGLLALFAPKAAFAAGARSRSGSGYQDTDLPEQGAGLDSKTARRYAQRYGATYESAAALEHQRQETLKNIESFSLWAGLPLGAALPLLKYIVGPDYPDNVAASRSLDIKTGIVSTGLASQVPPQYLDIEGIMGDLADPAHLQATYGLTPEGAASFIADCRQACINRAMIFAAGTGALSAVVTTEQGHRACHEKDRPEPA